MCVQFHLPRKISFAFFIILSFSLISSFFLLFIRVCVRGSKMKCFFIRSFFYNEFNMHVDCILSAVHDVHEWERRKKKHNTTQESDIINVSFFELKDNQHLLCKRKRRRRIKNCWIKYIKNFGIEKKTIQKHETISTRWMSINGENNIAKTVFFFVFFLYFVVEWDFCFESRWKLF